VALSGFGRFSEPALLVLLALAEGDKHGWAISEDAERLSGRRLGPGTLYGAITRLEERGLIRAQQEDGRRKPYRLTGAGSDELRIAVERIATITRVAQRRLRLLEPGQPA
jgi:DNA-binding PadR family transcriptional regulator